VREAGDRAAAAERSMKALQAELEAARTDANKAKAEAARVKAAAEAAPPPEAAAAPPPEMAKAVIEVYENINDILSAMRNNMVLVQGELPNLKSDEATLKAVSEAVDSLVDNAETAKGALRSLRDLAETK
jgi:hypothetical protein